MFQFSAYPPSCLLCTAKQALLMLQQEVIYKDRVSPFGHLWIIASWQLPTGYRCRVRPLSVLSTKASAVCINVEYFLAYFNLAFILCPRFNRGTFPYSHFKVQGGPERTRTAYLLIANESFYQVNYGPVPIQVPAFKLLKTENY